MKIALLEARIKRLKEQSELDFVEAKLKREREKAEIELLQIKLENLAPLKIQKLEAKLKQVTQQRDRALGRINWICDQLGLTNLNLRQRAIKKQAELETNLDLLQIDLDTAQAISEDEQLKKLKVFPKKGQLID